MAKRSYKDENIAKVMAVEAMPAQNDWAVREARMEALRLVYANSETGADVEDVLKEAHAVAEFLQGK